MHTNRWAILGTGSVAEKFVQGLSATRTRQSISTVASRKKDNAVRFAGRFGASAADSYADAVSSPEVGAVYIATPPAQHEEHALLAIQAGKAVLIEKPFAIDAASSKRIVKAARRAGVFCMEAMWTRFQPLVQNVRRRIDWGEIGEPRQLSASFCIAEQIDNSRSLFDPASGGGALMHRGIYAISLARYLLGPVTEMYSFSKLGQTGVDEECVVTLRHENGAISNLRSSLTTTAPNGLEIEGTGGAIRFTPPLFRPQGARIFISKPRNGGGSGSGFIERLRGATVLHQVHQRLGDMRSRFRPGGKKIFLPYAGNGYAHEADAVHAALVEGALESSIMPLDESVEIMQLVDQIKAMWSTARS